MTGFAKMRHSAAIPTQDDGDGPDPVDTHVGRRIRLRRNLLGVSQEGLASAIGISFRQVQKYEQGLNRVSASRLYDIARVLNVPTAYFFEDLDPAVEDNRAVTCLGEAEAPRFENDQMSRTETLRLMRAYWAMPSNELRGRVLELLESFSPRHGR